MVQSSLWHFAKHCPCSSLGTHTLAKLFTVHDGLAVVMKVNQVTISTDASTGGEKVCVRTIPTSQSAKGQEQHC